MQMTHTHRAFKIKSIFKNCALCTLDILSPWNNCSRNAQNPKIAVTLLFYETQKERSVQLQWIISRISDRILCAEDVRFMEICRAQEKKISFMVLRLYTCFFVESTRCDNRVFSLLFSNMKFSKFCCVLAIESTNVWTWNSSRTNGKIDTDTKKDKSVVRSQYRRAFGISNTHWSAILGPVAKNRNAIFFGKMSPKQIYYFC